MTLISFISKLDLLPEEHFRFRDGKSTEWASQTFTEYSRGTGSSTSGDANIFLSDCSYDVLNHHILLDKLEPYGTRGTLNEWFTSYLSHCTQFVKITQMDHYNSLLNGYLSSHRELSCSAPQGPILGPSLFLLYIHDLPRCYVQKGLKTVLYADDTNILLQYRDENALKLKTESVTKQLKAWFLNNELLILNTENLCEVFSF
jgi:hypothetical protein